MLSLTGVTKVYRAGTFGGTRVPAVTDVTFDVRPGEVVSLIGESGSGKTTVGRMILGLTEPTSGSISCDGIDVAALRGRSLRTYYASVQGVFQDPFSSYNPVFRVDRVFTMIRRPFLPGLGNLEWKERLHGALEAVSLEPGSCSGSSSRAPSCSSSASSSRTRSSACSTRRRASTC